MTAPITPLLLSDVNEMFQGVGDALSEADFLMAPFELDECVAEYDYTPLFDLNQMSDRSARESTRLATLASKSSTPAAGDGAHITVQAGHVVQEAPLEASAAGDRRTAEEEAADDESESSTQPEGGDESDDHEEDERRAEAESESEPETAHDQPGSDAEQPSSPAATTDTQQAEPLPGRIGEYDWDTLKSQSPEQQREAISEMEDVDLGSCRVGYHDVSQELRQLATDEIGKQPPLSGNVDTACSNRMPFNFTDSALQGVVVDPAWYDVDYDFTTSPFIGMVNESLTNAMDVPFQTFALYGSKRRLRSYRYSIDSSLLPRPHESAIFKGDRWYAYWCRHSNPWNDRHPVCFRCQLYNGLPVCFINTTWPCCFCLLNSSTEMQSRVDVIWRAIARHSAPDGVGWDAPCHARRRLPRTVCSQLDVFDKPVRKPSHLSITVRRQRARGQTPLEPAQTSKVVVKRAVKRKASNEPLKDNTSGFLDLQRQEAEAVAHAINHPTKPKRAKGAVRARRSGNRQIPIQTPAQKWYMRGKVNRQIGQNLRRERFLVYQACKAHVWARVRALNRSVYSQAAEQVLLSHCEKLRKRRLADPNTPLPLVTEPLDADERANILASYAPGDETPPPRNERPLPEDAAGVI